jgi:hypothetical protein
MAKPKPEAVKGLPNPRILSSKASALCKHKRPAKAFLAWISIVLF